MVLTRTATRFGEAVDTVMGAAWGTAPCAFQQ